MDPNAPPNAPHLVSGIQLQPMPMPNVQMPVPHIGMYLSLQLITPLPMGLLKIFYSF